MEGFFRITNTSAHLALQNGIPTATIQARIIEAHGHCRRPPKDGEKIILMDGRLYTVNNPAIRAMKRVIFDFISAHDIEHIVKAYLGQDNGDPYRITTDFFDCEVHVYVVIAVLDTLRDRGRLPTHPSRF